MRKQKALEQRGLSQSGDKYGAKLSNHALERGEQLRDKRLAEELYENTRDCTENDIRKYYKNSANGYLNFFSQSYVSPKWKEQRDSIVKAAAVKAIAKFSTMILYHRQDYYDYCLETALDILKQRNTPLYKALQ